MSGGAYDYAYQHITTLEQDLRVNEDPRRAAFKKILKLVSDAAMAVEWVDSCDYGPGDDYEAIDKLLGSLSADPELARKAAAYDMIMGMILAEQGMGCQK